ncbi:hypothetical protein ACFY15_35360 [Streptomyces sp. NPDC001373]|uniref:hypothetical protein n=1 Tax=Streptomyces sp. NPDC001373 TaxID=3364565 RepID=UPI0036B161BF
MEWPALLDAGGQTGSGPVCAYLVAAILNAGHPEVADAAVYSDEAKHPGVLVIFHSGAKGYVLLTHTA